MTSKQSNLKTHEPVTMSEPYLHTDSNTQVVKKKKKNDDIQETIRKMGDLTRHTMILTGITAHLLGVITVPWKDNIF